MSLPSVDEALTRILALAAPRPEIEVPLAEAGGRVLTRAVRAAWDLPGAAVSVMDGVAARAQDLAGRGEVTLILAGESAAGHPLARPLRPGEVAAISTGAVLPAGSDCVVPREDLEIREASVRVNLARYGVVHAGRFVRARGSDVQAGAAVLEAGTRLAPPDLGAAAAVGATSLWVHRPPEVAILRTGDEVVPLGTIPARGQVVDSNGIVLRELVRGSGGRPRDLGIAPDDPVALRDLLVQGLEADLLLTAGGISVGEHDLVARTLEDLGCTFVLHGVALRPGKPLGVAVRGSSLVLALPGNPASALVGFWLFAHPVLRRMAGAVGPGSLPEIRVRLRAPAPGAGARAHYLRARLHHDGSATPLQDQTSGNLTSMADFDALVGVPAGAGRIEAGETATAWVVDPWWTERRRP